VQFQIRPGDLMFVGRDNKWIREEGEFSVMIADRQATFVFNKSQS
jgi:hypothetical protein